MVRIRGRIGDWPVDLTLELDAEDWAQLAEHVAVTPAAVPPVAAPAADSSDRLWQTTLQLVRDAGSVEGRDCWRNWPHWLAVRRRASACWCACATARRFVWKPARMRRSITG